MEEDNNETIISRPTVVINLNPVLEAFCRWTFNTPADDKTITVSRRYDIGKHIYSHVKDSALPVPVGPDKTNPVVFTLPLTLKETADKFMYVDQWGELKINDFIKSEFNFWCRRRFEIGILYGWTQKEIADAILRGLNLRDNSVNFDAIKKNDYRTRRKVQEIRFENLFIGENQ